MYFGLIEVPTYFMDLTRKVFMEYLDKFVIAFINDVLVYSNDEEEHKEHLCLLLQKLRDHRLYAKLSKCEFWMKQVSFLSHVILGEGICVDSSKIRDMLGWNAPSSVIDSRTSLGLVGYYQKIVEGFSKTTKPIIELLEKDKKFKWTLLVKLDFRSQRRN
jgi:hypothetical protein